MKVTQDTLRKIAHLARLDFEEKDENSMIESLNDILTWVDQLNEIDTEGVEPITSMSQEINVMREDKVGPHLPHEKGLLNAPSRDEDYFRVPKVIE